MCLPLTVSLCSVCSLCSLLYQAAYDDRIGTTGLVAIIFAALVAVLVYVVPIYRFAASMPQLLFSSSLVGFAASYAQPAVNGGACRQLMTTAQLAAAGPTFQTPRCVSVVSVRAVI